MASGLTRSEQIALVGVGLMIVFGVGYQRYRHSSASLDPPDSHWRSVTTIRADGKPASDAVRDALRSEPKSNGSSSQQGNSIAPIDLNAATLEQLDSLPGIGPVRAQDIVAAREARGGFKSIDELLEVRGIGKVTLEKLRPALRVDVAPTTATVVVEAISEKAPPSSAMDSSDESKSAPEKININTASAEDLEKIPGVGPALATRIIAARGVKPFARPEDLINVKGIGPKTFEKMRASVSVE